MHVQFSTWKYIKYSVVTATMNEWSKGLQLSIQICAITSISSSAFDFSFNEYTCYSSHIPVAPLDSSVKIYQNFHPAIFIFLITVFSTDVLHIILGKTVHIYVFLSIKLTNLWSAENHHLLFPSTTRSLILFSIKIQFCSLSEQHGKIGEK